MSHVRKPRKKSDRPENKSKGRWKDYQRQMIGNEVARGAYDHIPSASTVPDWKSRAANDDTYRD